MMTNLVLLMFLVGALTGLVVAGAIIWAKDLGLKMTWWKWFLAALWYLLLNFFVFLDFTLVGEGEPGAGLKLFFFQAVLMIVLFVGLVRLLRAGRAQRP
jgi:hypothetical protein